MIIYIFWGYEIPVFQYSKKCYERYFLSSFHMCGGMGGGAGRVWKMEVGIVIVLLSADEGEGKTVLSGTPCKCNV